MNKRIKVRNEHNAEITVEISLPNLCPRCGHGIEPVYKSSFSVGDNLTVFFKCPSCSEGFISSYIGTKLGYPEFVESLPSPSETRSFPESISAISPEFIEIYNQAFLAEQSGYRLICGMGYRKALEFFVKDFAIYTHPDEESSISELSLSNCIDAYVEATNIKSLAKASAWIGNDETHYVRKHPDFSCEDLKAFINAFVSYVDMTYECERAATIKPSRR